MMALLRQCRSLLIVLFLAAPGLGGTWLPLVHPCLESGQTSEVSAHHSTAGAHGTADTHHADASADTSAGEYCHCIGACQAAAGAAGMLVAAPSIALAPAAYGWATGTPTYYANPLLQRHLDRHPPATAPPLV